LIDLHCHVLPGIDDGPKSPDAAIALARAAAEGGTSTIVATPHVTWDLPNDAVTISRLVGELNARLELEEIDVTVRPGAEVAISRALDLDADELGALSLGGGPWVLIEPPFSSLVVGLDAQLLELQRRGHQIVIAHPERCPAFHRDADALARLVEAGMLTSITAGSLTGRFGRRVKQFGRELIDRRLVHNVASDAHDARLRPPQIASEMADAGLQGLAEWAAHDVPAAILDGREIPPRPELPSPRRRKRWWRGR
jgi:protein-tyrosine phosphatase